MSLATDLRTRVEEALERSNTQVTETVTDVSTRVQGLLKSAPTVDVKQITDTVEGYRKAAQEQVDTLLRRDPRLAKVADTVEGYSKIAQQSAEGLVEQFRNDPRLAKVVETVDQRLVKPARARFAAAADATADAAESVEHAATDAVSDLDAKQVELADADAPVQVKETPVAPARKAPTASARKAPARKATAGRAAASKATPKA